MTGLRHPPGPRQWLGFPETPNPMAESTLPATAPRTTITAPTTKSHTVVTTTAMAMTSAPNMMIPTAVHEAMLWPWASCWAATCWVPAASGPDGSCRCSVRWPVRWPCWLSAMVLLPLRAFGSNSVRSYSHARSPVGASAGGVLAAAEGVPDRDRVLAGVGGALPRTAARRAGLEPAPRHRPAPGPHSGGQAAGEGQQTAGQRQPHPHRRGGRVRQRAGPPGRPGDGGRGGPSRVGEHGDDRGDDPRPREGGEDAGEPRDQRAGH